MEDTYLAHHGVKGMKWGVRRTPEQLGYKSTGSRLAKPGLETDFASKSTPHYKVRYVNGVNKSDYYHPTKTSSERSKVNARVTGDKKLRQLNRDLATMESRYGETSKEATAARAAFYDRGQLLASKYVGRLAKAYASDTNQKLSRSGKRALENQLMREVYLGPANWYDGMEKRYARAMGIPTRL